MKQQVITISKHPLKAARPWKKKLLTSAMAVFIMSVGVTTPSIAEAKGGKHHHHKHHHHKHHPHKRHNHKHHVVVVKPKPKPPKKVVVVRKPPRHRYYHRSRLPEIATFAVIAGATYAVIDNHYYKRSGDRYEYVEKPR